MCKKIAGIVPAGFAAIARRCHMDLKNINFNTFTFSSSRFSSSKYQHKLYDPIDTSESKFDKILVANRGEIACRIMRTAQRMNIQTVAIHSTIDSNAVHTRMANEAVCVGNAQSINSYLRIDKILQAVEETGAQAVHPGYGFLSENAEFVKQLESRGVVFIGPSAKVVAEMGDKLQSKQLAAAAGVNTIPGFDEVLLHSDHCVEAARAIGYPVMIKASGGGGGKGMRIARNDIEASEGFQLCTQEAMLSFGDDRIMVEKYIENPRHIEIQILGDHHGNTIYLNERECSIQRRNQKVVEEAPSTFLSDSERSHMGQQAVSLCRTIGYHSAGTVEFLVDGTSGQFYFLEMNTRIQVEHPVTEVTTGIDLVHQMLRIAKGHPLKIKQTDVQLNGWAIECRVSAEDPLQEFGLPSTGRLYSYIEPNHLDKVRCDSGVEEGSEIGVHYDALISKLICSGRNREEAIAKCLLALDQYVIRGVKHNIPLLRDVLTQKLFASGSLSTNFLPQVYPDGFKGRKLAQSSKDRLLAVASCIFASEDLRSRTYHSKARNRAAVMTFLPIRWQLSLTLDGEQREAIVEKRGELFEVSLGGTMRPILVKDDINLASKILPIQIDGSMYYFQSVSRSSGGSYRMVCEGSTFEITVMTELAAKYFKLMHKKPKMDSSRVITSPMPGLVKSVSCSVGDIVSEGQELCVIEAMKMQNSLLALSVGKVKEIRVKAGDAVVKDSLLIVLN